MAPLKFEDKMKEKLEQRAIIPSKDSWDRLANELDNVQHKKKQSKKIWLYSAAAIFVGILLTSIFINQRPIGLVQPELQIVENNEELIKNENINGIVNESTQENLLKEKKPTLSNQVKDNKTSTVSKEKHKERTSSKSVRPSSDVASSNTAINSALDDQVRLKEVIRQDDKDIISIADNVLPIDSLIIQDKVATVVAQIKDLEKNNIKVTDAEIDQLLMNAQREIATSKIIKSSAVSASALLQDVENELDESFKQRVFDALKKGFQKVRTAVVERDN
ncbi:hypothetical protein AWE51_10945 [Aquimarina aggregata]|uniref:Uncharacterized protein n=1 Tax=Aquimarina aggregata TaxID=1642818 RepID=A0A162YDU2_9FLAO|nr:hypothetical protein [Aquimarina aggregata]KZS39069.1 hypothetical protein AWE51_10945 [Aquimarina aggregata]